MTLEHLHEQGVRICFWHSYQHCAKVIIPDRICAPIGELVGHSKNKCFYSFKCGIELKGGTDSGKRSHLFHQNLFPFNLTIKKANILGKKITRLMSHDDDFLTWDNFIFILCSFVVVLVGGALIRFLKHWRLDSVNKSLNFHLIAAFFTSFS